MQSLASIRTALAEMKTQVRAIVDFVKCRTTLHSFDPAEGHVPDLSQYPLCEPAFLDHYTLVNVASDGSCFYRSISVLLFGIPDFHFAIRVATAAAFNEKEFEFDLLLKRLADPSYFETFKLILTNKEWAFTPTIFATALGISRRLFIYRPFTPLSNPPLTADELLAKFHNRDIICNRHVLYDANVGYRQDPLTLFNPPGHFVPCMKHSVNSPTFPAYWDDLSNIFAEFGRLRAARDLGIQPAGRH
jgi:hypothetical protein